ncbi:MAG: hypothetical protein ACREA9_29575 [Pyrinomonadaceae bacterium]
MLEAIYEYSGDLSLGRAKETVKQGVVPLSASGEGLGERLSGIAYPTTQSPPHLWGGKAIDSIAIAQDGSPKTPTAASAP